MTTIKLERMDWEAVKTSAIQQIRQAKITLEMAEFALGKAEAKLKDFPEPKQKKTPTGVN